MVFDIAYPAASRSRTGHQNRYRDDTANRFPGRWRAKVPLDVDSGGGVH